MIIGHNRIIKFLLKAAESDNLSHAYLFSGPESVGKSTTALEFAKFLQCPNAELSPTSFKYCDQCKDCYDVDKKSHPDILIIEPQDKDITIKQIRDLIKTFGFKNYSAPYKIAIIDEADKMTTEAANALLKTLEEPTKDSLLMLIASHPDALPSTILSRCQQMKFSPLAYQDLEEGLLDYYRNDSGAIVSIPESARISSGRPGLAIRIIQDAGFKERRLEVLQHFIKLTKLPLSYRYQYVDRLFSHTVDAEKDILDAWLYFLKDLIYLYFNKPSFVVHTRLQEELQSLLENYSLSKVVSLIDKIKEIRFLLRTTNVNKKLAFEVLMLEL